MKGWSDPPDLHLTDPDWRVRLKQHGRLGRLVMSGHYPHLQQCIRDGNDDVREMAKEAR